MDLLQKGAKLRSVYSFCEIYGDAKNKFMSVILGCHMRNHKIAETGMEELWQISGVLRHCRLKSTSLPEIDNSSTPMVLSTLFPQM